ncbi:MAG: BatA domain-containing protein [Planctomycetota bacterium]
MNWANLGALGLGGVLLSVPIILHFLMQPKPVNIDFPALRFLKKKQQTTRSRMRIKHFLLLLVRCLLILLVAVALAGPSVASNEFGNWLSLGGVGFSALVVGGIALLAYLRPKKNWPLVGILVALFIGHLIYGGVAASRLLNSESANLIGDDQAPVAALVVIDTSPRMELQFENQTRLEKAAEISNWLVEQFPGESQVCIAFSDGSPPFFSVDTGAAGRRIESMETNYSGTRLPVTIMEGLKILEESPLERKEIYVVSDLTRESWVGENSNRLVKRLERDKDYTLFVIDVGVPLPNNFSLGDLRLSSPDISSGGQLTVSTQIRRIGDAGPATVNFKLERIDPARPVVRDGVSVFSESFYPDQTANKELDSNGSRDIQFTFSDDLDVGTYHGSVQLEAADGLAIDDQRFFSFRVSPTHDTLVIHPSNVQPRVMVSLLAPRDAVEDGSARYTVDVKTQEQLANEDVDFQDYDAVFLLDPQTVDDPFWEKLQSFAELGGGVGIFLGHNANINGQVDPSFTTETAQRIIGGEIDVLWFNEEDDLFISPKELSHPIFRPIVGYETSLLWHRHPINKHWGLQVDGDNETYPTQTLLRYGNREPAVVERAIGLGRVITFTTPITEYSYNPDRRVWNRLFSTNPVPVAAYLLTLGIAEHLVQTDADSLNVQVGQSAIFQNDLKENPESYQVFSPTIDKPPTTIHSVEGKIRYRFNNTPGHFRLRGIFDEQVVLKGFSSNLSVAATDLSRLRPEELDEFLGSERYQLATQKNEIQRQQGTTRRGQEFYPLVVIMMLVILGVEYLMSNRFYS